MFNVHDLFTPLTLNEFIFSHLGQSPFASPSTATALQTLAFWDLFKTILESGHKDCWLVRQGKLHDAHKENGFLPDGLKSQKEFSSGFTVLVRHSEMAQEDLQKIAQAFLEIFPVPIDIQLFMTPAYHEGFDWHYDCEDVFIIQSSGEKEFTLRKNTDLVLSPKTSVPKDITDFINRSVGPCIQCLLTPGDFLYIPRGYWHRARALKDSFHLSVGLNFLNKEKFQYEADAYNFS